MSGRDDLARRLVCLAGDPGALALIPPRVFAEGTVRMSGGSLLFWVFSRNRLRPSSRRREQESDEPDLSKRGSVMRVANCRCGPQIYSLMQRSNQPRGQSKGQTTSRCLRNVWLAEIPIKTCHQRETFTGDANG